MIATETIVPNKKLKVKFSTKRIEATPGRQLFELGQQVSLVGEWNHTSSMIGNIQSEMKKTNNSVICRSDGGKKLDPEYLKEKSSMLGSNKRGPSDLIDCPREKRQRMDRSLTSQCSIILKKLMTHPASWVFKHPVDPVALSIPDYFSIISKPMDLGTIKSKLEKNIYFGAEEFAADVRLTFSNAMLYNPPTNEVHKMAVELKMVFEKRWEALEEKWNCENSKVGQGKLSIGRMKETKDTRQNVHKTPPLQNNLLLKRSMSSIEPARRSCDGRDVEIAKTAQKCSQKLSGKDFHKGIESGRRHACGSVNSKPPLSPIAHKCGRCGSISCQCSISCDSTHASSRDLSLERSLDRDHRLCGVDASRQAKSMPVSQMSKSDPDSDGAVSALDDENTCLSSQPSPPVTDAASQGGWNTPVFDVQLSPKKALRAAMLKSRFAETILKAQHKTLLDHGDKADPSKMRQEKERLERRQREERARIEAQIRAAEAAARLKEEAELKQQRQREREAARVALQKMERTVDLTENMVIQKEIEMLFGCSVSYRLQGSLARTLLEQLGLYIKDDDDDDELILDLDGEEGEIFS